MRQALRLAAGLLLASAGAAQAAAGFSTLLAERAAARVRAAAAAAAPRAGWPAQQRWLEAALAHARLSGEDADYLEADRARAAMRRLAPTAAAGCVSEAELHLALHRLAAARAALDACAAAPLLTADEAARLPGLRADVAFYRGDYTAALDTLRAALRSGETVGDLARLSRLHAAFGHRSEALALLDRAERIYHGPDAQVRAWLRLQRAVLALDAGRWEEALAQLLAAERHVAGWWLVDEHIAEVLGLLGRSDEARARQRRVLAHSSRPEFAAALATLEAAAGASAEAARLQRRAQAGFDARLARFPEAAAGHALEHALEHGAPAQALRLAQANAANRPFGEALIQLARAQLRAGDTQAALRSIDAVRATAWDSAELHAVAAQIHAAANQPEAAAEAARAARSRNPRAARQYGLP